MTTKEMIRVMTAFTEGKKIEYNETGGIKNSAWDDCYSPVWDWGRCDYRVKKAPKEIWVNEYPDGKLQAHNTKGFALKLIGGNATRVAIHYREVKE